MSKSEYTKYLQFQTSKQLPPTQPSATLVQTDNPIACLSHTNSKSIINPDATNHLMG